MILFNENVHKLFRFSSKFINDIGGSEGINGESTGFYANNIYFIYFGLCFLGFGSFLFNVFCPDQIKNEPVIDNYLSNVDLRENSVVAKSNLEFVLNAYITNVGWPEQANSSSNPEYPLEVESDFGQLIHEMFDRTMDMPEQKEWAGEERSEQEDGFLSSMYTGSGYPNIGQIAFNVWSSPKVIWAFTMPFKSLSSIHAKDIAFVMYKTLNYSRYRARLFVFLFYAIGFYLLLVPTIVTFFRLTWHFLLSAFGFVH